MKPSKEEDNLEVLREILLKAAEHRLLNNICESCGGVLGKLYPDKNKCPICRMKEDAFPEFDKVTKEITDKNPLPNCFFIVKE